MSTRIVAKNPKTIKQITGYISEYANSKLDRIIIGLYKRGYTEKQVAEVMGVRESYINGNFSKKRLGVK